YFSEQGLEYKEELDQKVYTKSDKADEVIEVLKNDLKNNNVKIMFNTKIEDLIVEDNTVKGVISEGGKRIYGDKVIVTTGGKSFPNTGSDGSMYDVIKKYGHTITPI
ncbi:NAD(P)/FAD-dependent oxidoreductase, partial [Klebsiella pneumoniae]|nr:NAD(P)/FAD-dependent oxidoreductase [Klebsiella pneumoniae]